MKNIIIPVDFSEDCLKGLDMAVTFSKKGYINVQMVYVQKKTFDLAVRASNDEYEYAETKFKRLISMYQPRMENDSKLRYIIKKGRVYQEIVSQSRSYNESLIIVSTHGASGYEEIFIGSNAAKIVSEADRPVITIRKDPVPESINTIVMPIDILMDSRQKVPYTAELADFLGAEIHVAPISNAQNKRYATKLQGYTKQVCAYLDSKNIAYKTHFLSDDNMADAIIDYSTSVNADLISIISEANPSVTDVTKVLFGGTYAQMMINKSPIPILNFKPKIITIKGTFNTVK